jgi:uncharacterized protein DUF1302
MSRKSYFIKKNVIVMGVLLVMTLALGVQPGMAFKFDLFGKPAIIQGFVNQGVGFGVAGDHYDTMEGFQQAVFQGLVEFDYELRHDLKFFTSGMLNTDLAYQRDSNEWERKGFDDSDRELKIFDEFRDILNEFHITWTPGNFLFRVGKQIVPWGELIGQRLIDQINPVDQRRGQTDIEFETTIIPIWLARIEYFPELASDWLLDLGFEFIFNPNADFRGDEGGKLGNDEAGIWAPLVEIPLPFPPYGATFGSENAVIDQPDDWDPDGYEYGVRVKANFGASYITLNYFYGRANSPAVLTRTPEASALTTMEASPYDGRLILHPGAVGYYPRLHFAGFTYARELEGLYSTRLGGVAPFLRMEAMYSFDSTIANAAGTALSEHDEIRWAAVLEWKLKINWLHDKSFITIGPQFTHHHIMDYPSDDLSFVAEDNYSASVRVVSPKYFNQRAWLEAIYIRVFDDDKEGDLILPKIVWDRDAHWNYTLGAIFVEGDTFEALDHKDQVYFTIGYRFF